MNQIETIRYKRLAGIDYGMKRVGIAVCDELHITSTPRITLEKQSEKFWERLISILKDERIFAVVVGMPERLDGKQTDVILEIKSFIIELQDKTGLPVYVHDESYSSRNASATMLEIGYGKRKRAKKGNTDMLAAALILREFLDENDR